MNRTSTLVRRARLVTRTPLARISAKRAAALLEAGKPLTARTTKRRDSGPSQATVALVVLRDLGRCGWCGDEITGLRGWDWSVSHRRPRRSGGDPRPDTNSPANLILAHGHALSRCHGEIEQQRREAKRRGHILPARAVPSRAPVDHAVHGWVLLDDNGGVFVYRAVAGC